MTTFVFSVAANAFGKQQRWESTFGGTIAADRDRNARCSLLASEGEGGG